MKSKILVIGSTGSIGTPLVGDLLQKGMAVKAATRNPERYINQGNEEVVGFDYDKPATFQAALDNVDQIFMLTKPTDSEPAKTIRPFIEQVKGANIRKIALVTSLPLGGGSNTRLGFGQLEEDVKASGINYTILRPGWFMSLFTSGFILSMIQQKSIISLPVGDARISLIDPCDIAAVAAESLCKEEHHNQEYALTGGQALTFTEIAAILSAEIGREITYSNVSVDGLREIIEEIGGYPGSVDLLDRVFAHVARGEAALVSPDVQKVTNRPPLSFTQFVQKQPEVWSSGAAE